MTPNDTITTTRVSLRGPAKSNRVLMREVQELRERVEELERSVAPIVQTHTRLG